MNRFLLTVFAFAFVVVIASGCASTEDGGSFSGGMFSQPKGEGSGGVMLNGGAK